MSKPKPQPAPAPPPNVQQCFQWARSGHNALSVLLEQADAFVPAEYGMDSDMADAIFEQLASAKSALATAYGVYHLAAQQVQADPNARYIAAQQQPQYVTGRPQ
jgi:hypothetical protein